MKENKRFTGILLNKQGTFGVSEMKSSEGYQFEKYNIIQLIDALTVLDTIKNQKELLVGFKKGYPLFLTTEKEESVGLAISPITEV